MSCNAKNCPAQIIKVTDDLCEQWDCEWRKPKTKGDSIRSMSDEELAKWLDYICDAWYCPIEGWLDWLKEEAK